MTNRISLLLAVAVTFLGGLISSLNAQTNGVSGLQTLLNDAQNKNGVQTIQIPTGTYHFYYEQGQVREVYISNHDQTNPKSIGIVMENLKNVTIDGQGSKFVFHGKMIPIVMQNCVNCTVKNLEIDFASPSICQGTILTNDSNGITMELLPESKYEIGGDKKLYFVGEGWKYVSGGGIAFDGKTRHMIYNSSDMGANLTNVTEIRPRVISCPNWKNNKLVPGSVFAFRSNQRPAPGLFLYMNVNTTLENIQVHYSEGMGLLAQLCDGIHLNKFSVCLRGEKDERYFTTQADATHFSGCKGLILSENGLYEGMTDDAINVHGTYLKVVKRVDDNTLEGRYMHGQSWGFHWGEAGNDVQFINSSTMEILGEQNKIESIVPVDKPTELGVRVFRIRFVKTVPEQISERGTFGIENLTWTPEVIFRKNVIRNNRARGALFSTPKKTIVEENLFDHTSGTAILLCGDCNGWFETGACRNVIIRKNTFINALTCYFQFTNAIISIYPEIPHLNQQQQYFHGAGPDSILIEDNVFETFDQPLVYAKSLDGLTFRHNTVKVNHDYPAFHWNNHRFFFQRVKNINITDDNTFEGGFDKAKDVKEE